MTEEEITITIMNWLINNKWEIISFDFPQSGTGLYLHPNNSINKTKDTINIDIIAAKANKCVFFENKNRFYLPDYKKIYKLRTSNIYSNDINRLLEGKNITKKYYGIGFPFNSHKKKSQENIHLVDFIVGVKNNQEINIIFQNRPEIFL